MSARGARVRVLGWLLVVLLLGTSAGAVVHGSTLAYGEPPTAESEVGGLPAPDDSRDRGAYAWRTSRLDVLFPERLTGGGRGWAGLTEQSWHRVGIAAPATCDDALDRRARRRLEKAGCRLVLRATYVDLTWTYVATLGIVVADDPQALRTEPFRGGVWGRTGRAHGMLPAAFPGTPAQGFRAPQRFATQIKAGEVPPSRARGVGSGWLAAASVGFADARRVVGRPGVVGDRDHARRQMDTMLGSFVATVRRS